MNFPLFTQTISACIKLNYGFFWMIVFCFSTNLSAQYIQFEEILAPPPSPQNQADFSNCNVYTQAFADVDGDNDEDLLLIGSYTFTSFFTKLYLNDGLGNFTEMIGTPFEAVNSGSIAFSDIDNDSDFDVLITGTAVNASTYSSKLYKNNGIGNFTLVSNTVLDQVSLSSIAFSDIDNDTDQDLVVTGAISTTQVTSKIYKNDGNGIFSVSQDLVGAAVKSGAVAFADIDNDFDQDLLITGADTASQPISKLFENNGMGIFQEIFNTTIEPIKNGSVAFADIDNDFDQDLMITGVGLNNLAVTNLYLNEGNSIFSLQYNTTFTNVFYSSVLIRDFDNDSDMDVFLSGNTNTGQSISSLYSSIGNGEFAMIAGAAFSGLGSRVNSAADIDNDNDLDILISGTNPSSFTIFYRNNGNNSFEEVSYSTLEKYRFPSVSHGDIDGDNDEDLIFSGRTKFNVLQTKFYLNDGDGNFSIGLNNGINELGVYRNLLVDIDNDADLDLMLTRLISTNNYQSSLYTNDGSGNFSLFANSVIDDSTSIIFRMIDIDSDSDLDIISLGVSTFSNKLYLNDGNGNFTFFIDSVFENITSIKAFDMADVDNDGDQDVMLIGNNSTTVLLNLFLNDGLGHFSLASEFSQFAYINSSNIGFADIDNDSDKDLYVMGNILGQIISRFLINDGQGNFTALSQNVLDGKLSGTINFADVDNDQDVDVMLTGQNSVAELSTSLFTNDGEGNFELVENLPFIEVNGGNVTFFHCDSNTSIDVLIVGRIGFYNFDTKLYRNISCTFSQFEPSIAELPDLVYTCYLPEITPPTAMDNCAGLITGTTSTVFPLNVPGNYQITWSFDNGYGIVITQNQNLVILPDTISPIPQLSELQTIYSNCQVSALPNPIAIDNCSGIIEGYSTIQFPITSLDTTLVVWSFEDSNGNISTQNQLVILSISDTITPNQLSLPSIYSNCQVNFIEPPTASLNCDTAIIGTTDVIFPITSSGITEIVWTYSDGNGMFVTQNQQVEIEINAVPVPVVPNLPTVYSICPIDSSPAPLATFNCEGFITATTTTNFPIQSGDTTEVSWIFTSAQGDVFEQVQLVIVSDTVKPVPLFDILPDILVSCELTELNPPPAFDNCSGIIYGTTDFSLPISNEGTYEITWLYDDGNGNTRIQTQNVILNHAISPIPNQFNLPAINSVCKIYSLVPPTATFDCSQVITGTPNVTFPIGEGITNITWTFNAGNGFTSTQHQIITIQDNIDPVPELASLPNIYLDCESITSLIPPTAIDNCTGLIYATTNTIFPISNSTSITWSFDDGNGNIVTQDQHVINSYLNSVDNSVLQIDAVTFQATASGYRYQWVNCDSNQWISGAIDQTFTATANGNYSVIIFDINCDIPLAFSTCLNVNSVGLEENEANHFKIYPNPTKNELIVQSDSELKWITLKDLDGKLVQQFKVQGTYYSLLLDDLNDGVYLIEVQSETGIKIDRVIKVH